MERVVCSAELDGYWTGRCLGGVASGVWWEASGDGGVERGAELDGRDGETASGPEEHPASAPR
ncbi:hypothetical protein ACIBTP_37085 [Streptomyces avidinii]|uniref:hypothetical protein n=1 Tax=Streptomyces TaxID=1883 RepID=UPI001C1F3E8E|nr:hypothetical protein [Streptomyces sp. ADI95-16]